VNILSKILMTIFLVLGLGVTLPFVNQLVKAQTPALTMTHTADRRTAQPGETINYTVTVTNVSSSTVTNMFMMSPITNGTYTLGSGVVVKTNPSIQVATPDTWYSTGLDNFGTLNPGGVMTVTYKAIVNSGAANGSYVQSAAQIWADQQSAFNVTASTQILNNPILCSSITADKNQVVPGDTVEFSMRLCNNGNTVLHNVVIRGWVPNVNNPLSTYVSGSTTASRSGVITQLPDTWINTQTPIVIGDLNPGVEVFVKYRVRVNNSLAAGTILEAINQSRSDETPETQCAVQVKVVAPAGAPAVTLVSNPVLSVRKFVVYSGKEYSIVLPRDVKKFNKNEEVLYRMKVENSTDQVAKDVKLTDVIADPKYLDYVSNNLNGTWDVGNNTFSVSFGDIAAKTTRTIDVTFKVKNNIPTVCDVEQRNFVTVTSNNAGEHKADANITVCVPSAQAKVTAKQVKELPKAGGEVFLTLGLAPIGVLLRKFKIV